MGGGGGGGGPAFPLAASPCEQLTLGPPSSEFREGASGEGEAGGSDHSSGSSRGQGGDTHLP